MDKYLNVTTHHFHKVVKLPTSKSASCRALILGSMVKRPFTINGLSDAQDTVTLKTALKKIGIVFDGNTIVNSFPECEVANDNPIEILTGDGGTTNRLLLAMLANGKNTYRLISSERFKARPNRPLIEALKQLGATITVGKDTDNFFVEIKAQGMRGVVEVDCSQSTQFATALMLSNLYSDTTFSFINVGTSKPYLDLTKRMIDFVRDGADCFDLTADFSAAAYPAALAAVAGSVNFKDVTSVDYSQADAQVFKLLEHTESTGGILVFKQHINAFNMQCGQCLDLVPVLSFLACFADGTSHLTQIKNLQFKESDRLNEIIKLLRIVGAQFEYDEIKDELSIVGGSCKKSEFIYDAPSDHRMIMTAYLFMRALNGGKISNFSHVKKSFPNFFSEME